VSWSATGEGGMNKATGALTIPSFATKAITVTASIPNHSATATCSPR
jgi:hypothetical protein